MWINNYLQRKWKVKADLRQERKQAYIANFVVQWVSFIRNNVKRRTALSYQEMGDQFKIADFSIVINAVKLVAHEYVCSLCDRLDAIVNGKCYCIERLIYCFVGIYLKWYDF